MEFYRGVKNGLLIVAPFWLIIIAIVVYYR